MKQKGFTIIKFLVVVSITKQQATGIEDRASIILILQQS